MSIPNQVADGGKEHSVWHPTTHTFFVSVPTNGTVGGGVQAFDVNGNAVRT